MNKQAESVSCYLHPFKRCQLSGLHGSFLLLLHWRHKNKHTQQQQHTALDFIYCTVSNFTRCPKWTSTHQCSRCVFHNIYVTGSTWLINVLADLTLLKSVISVFTCLLFSVCIFLSFSRFAYTGTSVLRNVYNPPYCDVLCGSQKEQYSMRCQLIRIPETDKIIKSIEQCLVSLQVWFQSR